MNNTQVIAVDRLEPLKNKVFDTLDVYEDTRREYFVRVDYFLRFTEQNGLNEGSYLGYKRFLAGNDTYSVSTKNKYLISVKVFLDGLYRLRLIPYKVTDGVKGFQQSRLHKKDGLTDDDVGKLQTYFSTLEPSGSNTRKRAIIALFLFQGFLCIDYLSPVRVYKPYRIIRAISVSRYRVIFLCQRIHVKPPCDYGVVHTCAVVE